MIIQNIYRVRFIVKRNNSKRKFCFVKDIRDKTGIRYFISNELRQHDLGYFTLGVQSGPAGIVIPPNMEQFSIDAFCPSQATEVLPMNLFVLCF